MLAVRESDFPLKVVKPRPRLLGSELVLLMFEPAKSTMVVLIKRVPEVEKTKPLSASASDQLIAPVPALTGVSPECVEVGLFKPIEEKLAAMVSVVRKSTGSVVANPSNVN